MVCIYCGNQTQVTNSRLQKRANQVWRRRQCVSCGNNFTTHEMAEYATAIAVRYSARDLQPFDRDRLFVSVYESCKHRAKALADAAALTQTIISTLRDHIQDGAIDRDTIAAVTHSILERFDTSAATMYQAYHPSERK